MARSVAGGLFRALEETNKADNGMITIIKFFLILIIMWPVYTQSQEPSPAPLKASKEQQNKPSPKQAESKDHQRGTDNLPFVVKIAKTSPTAQKESDNTKNSDNKSSSDWRKIIFDASLVIFNGLLAAFTLGLFISTRKMWKSTEKAANAAKDAAEALPLVERAYVYENVQFKKIEPIYSKDRGHEGNFYFSAEVLLYNFGKTPAVINRSQAIVSLKHPIIPQIEEIEIPSGIVLGSQTAGTPGTPMPVVSKIVNENEWKGDISLNKITAYCCGRIEYQDVFGRRWKTDFCWEFRRIDLDPGSGYEWVPSSKYKELNDRT